MISISNASRWPGSIGKSDAKEKRPLRGSAPHQDARNADQVVHAKRFPTHAIFASIAVFVAFYEIRFILLNANIEEINAWNASTVRFWT